LWAPFSPRISTQSRDNRRSAAILCQIFPHWSPQITVPFYVIFEQYTRRGAPVLPRLQRETPTPPLRLFCSRVFMLFCDCNNPPPRPPGLPRRRRWSPTRRCCSSMSRPQVPPPRSPGPVCNMCVRLCVDGPVVYPRQSFPWWRRYPQIGS